MMTSTNSPRSGKSHATHNVLLKTAGILLFAVTLLICLLLLELAGRHYIARVSGKMPVDFRHYHTDVLHRYDPELGWTMHPNRQLSLPSYTVSTNSLGLRNKELRPLEGQARILAIGDSRTYGEGADNEYTWPALLENKLNENQPGRFEVINAGVSGYNAFQGLRYLETRGMELKPNLVICAFGVNEWAKIEPGGAGWVEWEDMSSQWGIEALFRGAIKGCAAMISKPPFGPREYRMTPGEYTDSLVCMHELCQRHGSAFAVLYLPSIYENGKTDTFSVKALSAGIAGYCGSPFWDPSGVLPVPANEQYVDPFHFTASGNMFIAGYLYDVITTSGIF